MKALLLTILILIWVVLGTVLNGIVLEILWEWFVVPLDMPPISVAHAIGLSLVTRFATYVDDSKVKDERDFKEMLYESVPRHIGLMGLFMLVGVIAKGFM